MYTNLRHQLWISHNKTHSLIILLLKCSVINQNRVNQPYLKK
nr:MAG TPA: hypothetical protein [Caudoviricetes sp.]